MHISSSYEKYWGNKFLHTGDSPKWVKSKRRKKRKEKRGRGEKERLNDGNNNGQDTHGALKPPGPKDKLKLI